MSRMYRALEKAEKEQREPTGFFPGILEESASPAVDTSETKPRRNNGNGNGHFIEKEFSLVVPTADSFSAEQFRKLKTYIFRRVPQPRSILVTSCAAKEGKSTVSLNLALSISQEIQMKTILVDADLRKPTLYQERFGRQKGLSDYLSNEIPLSEASKTLEEENLTLFPGGTATNRAAELINSDKFKDLMKTLNGYGDHTYVIIDSPPILSTSESLLLSEYVDGVILVITAGMVSKMDVRRVVNSIGAQKIIGIVFNHRNLKPLKSYSSYYYRSYGYGKSRSLKKIVGLNKEP